MLKISVAIAAGAIAFAALTGSAGAATITISSFENPYLGCCGGNYGYNPSSLYQGGDVGAVPQTTVDGVTFGGMSGIQGNGSLWGFTPAPNGVQTAFLQSYSGEPTDPGYITFGDVLAAGADQLVFYAESRPSTGGLPFTVTINGTLTPTVIPAPPTTTWTLETVNFTATTGLNTFQIAINPLDSPTDNSIGLDAAPLPSTWTMLIAGFVGLGFLAYRGSSKKSAGHAAA